MNDRDDTKKKISGAAEPKRRTSLKLSEIADLLKCEVIVEGRGLEAEVTDIVASDGMSEVLAGTKSGELMITGLTNIQSIRTADISDACAVIYCRGRRPVETVLQLARNQQMPVLTTHLNMFDICGILYNAGLRGVT
ncbi:MAG: DRTGG domain-containing protein [Planctomycetota bacterium]|nr:DRTGG domain-containing protein [Planctomycetota bacterium]